jgi:hypothetical protein
MNLISSPPPGLTGRKVKNLLETPAIAAHIHQQRQRSALTTVTDRVTAAMSDVGCDVDLILNWCGDRGLPLTRAECQRTLKRLTPCLEEP